MPSPFPGMNPYLEQSTVWQDFHTRIVAVIGEVLAPQVSPSFLVRLEQSLFIHEPSHDERLRLGRADVALSGMIERSKRDSTGGQATLESPRQLTVATDFEIEKHSYLEIQDRQRRDVVAIIEVLSPSNKQHGADREQYLNKRRGIIHSMAHFVEIDLLRGGPKMPAEELQEGDYGVVVSKYEDRPKVNYWPIMLRERLPRIPVPIRQPVPLAWIDLQEVLNTVYDRAYYKDYIYEGQPEPPLSDADRAWAEELVKSTST